MTQIRYIINGCIAVAIQYGVYWLLSQWMEVNVAFAIGYLVSFTYNYFLTCYWTFKSKPTMKHFMGFAASNVVNYLSQCAFLNIMLWMGSSKDIAGIAAIVLAVPINYAILRWVFRK